MELDARALHVFFSSETGTARGAAYRAFREARRAGWTCGAPAPLDACPAAALATQARVALFVVATTGVGEPPSDMQSFWELLRRADLPRDSLSGLRYAVFGLGDSGYALYNAAARRLDARLAQLGASRLLPAGLGDARHKAGGHDAALDRWLPRLWGALDVSGALPARTGRHAHLAPQAAIQAAAAEGKADAPMVLVDVGDGGDGGGDAGAAAAALPRVEGAAAAAAAALRALSPHEHALEEARGACVAARVVSAGRATAEDVRVKDVRALRLALPPAAGAWCAGHVLDIWPSPPPGAVEALLARCGVPEKALVALASAPEGGSGAAAAAAAPGAVVVRALKLVAAYVDMCGATPSRACLAALAARCGDEAERARLAHFASREGAADLSLYARDDCRTLMEVLEDFPSASPTLAEILEHAPRLRARPMSVAGGANGAGGAEVELVVAAAEWETPRGRPRVGLCTRYLRRLRQGDSVRARLRPGAHRAPADAGVPLVLVGPGTGVAPLRALIAARGEAGGGGPVALFVGCRHKGLDDLFADEWQARTKDGSIALLAWAHSRDANNDDGSGSGGSGGPPKYVQHALARHADEVRALAARGAHFHVVGAAERMPDDVARAVDAICGAGFTTRAAAEGRYHVEAWS